MTTVIEVTPGSTKPVITGERKDRRFWNDDDSWRFTRDDQLIGGGITAGVASRIDSQGLNVVDAVSERRQAARVELPEATGRIVRQPRIAEGNRRAIHRHRERADADTH